MRGMLDYKLLLWQVHNVVQTAAMFFSPPVLDVYYWLPMVYAPLQEAAALDGPTVDSADDGVDPAIEGMLADDFKETRAFWEVLKSENTTAPWTGSRRPKWPGMSFKHSFFWAASSTTISTSSKSSVMSMSTKSSKLNCSFNNTSLSQLFIW